VFGYAGRGGTMKTGGDINFFKKTGGRVAGGGKKNAPPPPPPNKQTNKQPSDPLHLII